MRRAFGDRTSGMRGVMLFTWALVLGWLSATLGWAMVKGALPVWLSAFDFGIEPMRAGLLLLLAGALLIVAAVFLVAGIFVARQNARQA